ncbi:MAG: hypothetical protein OEL91_07715, partial [Burkholderiaceae bacterium]|nr:hypothetical protein [Burkholderiaceae bacterium]
MSDVPTCDSRKFPKKREFPILWENVGMQLDDPWRFPRADLAKHYLAMLTDAPRRPLAVFGPRQTGKTYFLTHD